MDWYATIASATHVRVNCDDHKGPVGESVGVASAGEVVRIVRSRHEPRVLHRRNRKGNRIHLRLLPERHRESSLPRPEPSIFRDLTKDHPYYSAIKT